MKEKIFEFVKKYKTLLFLAVTTIVLFFGGVWSPCWIIAAGLTVAFFAICSVAEIVAIVLYFLSFSAIGLHYIVVLIGAFLVIAIKYAIDVAKKRNQFYPLPFAITCFMVVVWSCIQYNIDAAGLEQGALFIALLFGMYLMFVSRDKLDIRKAFNFLTLGLIVSAVLCFATLIFENYAVELYHFDGTYKRLNALSYHYNFLQMAALFAIAYYVYAFVNKQGKWWENAVAVAIALVLGALTMSKAFVLSVGIIACYLFVVVIAKYKKKSVKFVIPSILAMLVMCFVLKDYLLKIIDRFTYSFQTGNILNQITTGRYDIWREYIAQITSSVPTMLFGFGFFNAFAGGIIAHNAFIHILHRIGFVGIILMVVLVYVYAKQAKSKMKITLSNCLPLFIYLFIALEEQVFSDRFFLFLVFAIILTLVPKHDAEEK